jgi:hypothetical protein
MTSLATHLETDLQIAALRSAATTDNPAGPLFTSEYAESDLTHNDPYLNCSFNTGSRTINCCA